MKCGGYYDCCTSDFDIKQHKAKYINYFEAVILPNGKVEYAIPSHQEKLVNIVMQKENKTKAEVWNSISVYDDVLRVLVDRSGCVSCWSKFICSPDKITSEQTIMLNILIAQDLTTGKRI